MMRALMLVSLVMAVGISTLDAQAMPPVTASRSLAAFQEQQRKSLLQPLVHYGKWLTAAMAIGATAMASNQHNLSRKEWDALLDVCRSAADACLTGPDGKYVRGDAEALYQRSRNYDVMANRWLMAAQLSLVTTTALFIIDLHSGGGPDNIPYPSEMRVGIGYRLPGIR
ncbi:MAG TPA: hypothetical protein VN513_17285 [Gemmatimonadales bacterium]|nr:hypothetical protein [Gemmatimonadales bacterium]